MLTLTHAVRIYANSGKKFSFSWCYTNQQKLFSYLKCWGEGEKKAFCQIMVSLGECSSFIRSSPFSFDSIDTRIVLLWWLVRDLWQFLWLRVYIAENTKFSHAVFRNIYFMGLYIENASLMLIRALNYVDPNTNNENIPQFYKELDFSCYSISVEFLF